MFTSMEFNRSREIEQFDEGRKKLLELEKEGKYVFHGSSDILQVLEPRQAYNIDQKTGMNEKDGNPAVFATPFADIAIFRALISGRNVSGDSESRFGMDDQGLHFSATQNLLDTAKSKIAKVYVLDKSKFINFEGSQCRSEEPNVPIQLVEVTIKDLPDNIKIIE